jgi:hypothetical protein
MGRTPRVAAGPTAFALVDGNRACLTKTSCGVSSASSQGRSTTSFAGSRSPRQPRNGLTIHRSIGNGDGNPSAARLHVTEAAVGKHVGNILTKLDLPPSDDTNRRVLAVLTYLRARPATP